MAVFFLPTDELAAMEEMSAAVMDDSDSSSSLDLAPQPMMTMEPEEEESAAPEQAASIAVEPQVGMENDEEVYDQSAASASPASSATIEVVWE